MKAAVLQRAFVLYEQWFLFLLKCTSPWQLWLKQCISLSLWRLQLLYRKRGRTFRYLTSSFILPPPWGVPSTAPSVTWFGVTLQMKRQEVDWGCEYAGMHRMYVGCIVGSQPNRRRPWSADVAGNVGLDWPQAALNVSLCGNPPLGNPANKTSSIYIHHLLFVAFVIARLYNGKQLYDCQSSAALPVIFSKWSSSI